MVTPDPAMMARMRVRNWRLMRGDRDPWSREKPISTLLNRTLNMADGPSPMAVDPPSVDLRLSPEEEGLLFLYPDSFALETDLSMNI